MLLSMLALFGHGSAVALGIDHCLDGAAHSATEIEESAHDGSPPHHPGAENAACCVGACTAANIEDRPAIPGERSHGVLQALLPPSGLDPGGLERPPRG